MKTKVLASCGLCAAVSIVTLTPRFAQAQDISSVDNHWVFRFGGHAVVPKSDSGNLAGLNSHIGSDVEPTASIEYMFTPNIGVDAVVAAPFRHDIYLSGVKAASTRELPPTLGVNYHFMPHQSISPFVGVGVNFTWFYSARGRGPLQGDSVAISNSVGPAAHAGFDIKLSERWLFTADVRWIGISSDVRVNGSKVGTAKVNPLVYGASFGYRF
jgi:outer membrane protein